MADSSQQAGKFCALFLSIFWCSLMQIKLQTAYLEKFKAEMQNQMVQDLMNKITDNCFKVI